MTENQTPEAQLQEQLSAEQEKNKQLTLQLEQEREANGKAEQRLREAEQTEQKLRTEIRDGQVLIDQLTQLANKPAPVASVPSVELDGQAYRFTVPVFRFEGAVVKAADVASDSALLKALVAAEAGVLEAVPAE